MTARVYPERSRGVVPWRPRPLPEPALDTTDPAWHAALDYLRPRRHLDHVSAEILAAFLAGVRAERHQHAEANDAD